MTIQVVVILLSLVMVLPWTASADPYINSAECDPADPNLLLCDDFEDGVWFNPANNAGDLNNDGWCGSPLFRTNPPPTAVCGGLGAAGTNCAATHGSFASPKPDTRIMAMHMLAAPANEIYIRNYWWLSPGYSTLDGEKLIDVNQYPSACNVGIHVVNFIISGGSTLTPAFARTNPSTLFKQNLGNNLTLSGGPSGTWYFSELNVKLSSPPGASNGRLRWWANNCGITGVCSGTPTLRMDHNNIVVNSGCEGRSCIPDLTKMSHIIFNAWSHLPGVTGERRTDQIKISKVGPIGFVGAVAPPLPPPPPQTFTLTANVAPAGGGTVTGGGTYPAGTSVTVNAMPSAGYTFAGWSGACTGMDACVVIMDAPWVVTANFAVVQPPPPPPAITGTCRWIFTPDAINPLAISCP